MSAYDEVRRELALAPRRWLVTGAAGFIGSHLTQELLALGQNVTGLDNFSTGRRSNLDAVRALVGDAWERFRMVEGDIRSASTCRDAVRDVDLVLHQAALGSVPRSIKDPVASFDVNVGGFLNMAVAARDAGKALVYASSSSVYGDSAQLPKVEDFIGRPLSPYAATKRINEVAAEAFAASYNMRLVGLRYFNVFGARQDPEGPYAAVIPRWMAAMLGREPCVIHGDGSTSRDFCFVSNVVQANLLCAVGSSVGARVFNVGCGGRTTLLELHSLMASELSRIRPDLSIAPPRATPARQGDIAHSLADVSRISTAFGYSPTHDVRRGMAETWRSTSLVTT